MKFVCFFIYFLFYFFRSLCAYLQSQCQSYAKNKRTIKWKAKKKSPHISNKTIERKHIMFRICTWKYYVHSTCMYFHVFKFDAINARVFLKYCLISAWLVVGTNRFEISYIWYEISFDYMITKRICKNKLRILTWIQKSACSFVKGKNKKKITKTFEWLRNNWKQTANKKKTQFKTSAPH